MSLLHGFYFCNSFLAHGGFSEWLRSRVQSTAWYSTACWGVFVFMVCIGSMIAIGVVIAIVIVIVVTASLSLSVSLHVAKERTQCNGTPGLR